MPRPVRDGPHDTAGTNEPVRHHGLENPRDQAKAAAGSRWLAAASTAARTKPATARERLVSGQAAMTSLGLRSLTGTNTGLAVNVPPQVPAPCCPAIVAARLSCQPLAGVRQQ